MIVTWGTLGIVALVSQALVRLTPMALEPIVRDLMSPAQWALYIGWVVVNAHAEGYRGFQRRFSPRVVARAFHLAEHPRPLHVALAPFFCMSYFHASSRGLKLSWGVSLTVVTLVLLVRMLPQPWRGIVDGGVVVGLGWGLISLVVHWGWALRHGPPQVELLLPDPVASA